MLQFVKRNKKSIFKYIFMAVLVIGTGIHMNITTLAATGDSNNLISVDVSSGAGNDMASVLQMLLVLTVIAIAPSILIIVIVLHFTRTAIGTQTVPPNQILIGLSLFLTIFVMSPTFTQIYDSAVVPLSNNEISAEEAFETGVKPLREFMLKQVSNKDLDTFLKIAGYEDGSIASQDDIPLQVLIPSFIISELRIAFIIGFLIYLPFIVIDMVVASTLMSMGMMMLPPTTISMPFKILLFVMADGWNLIIGNLMTTFK